MGRVRGWVPARALEPALGQEQDSAREPGWVQVPGWAQVLGLAQACLPPVNRCCHQLRHRRPKLSRKTG